MGAEYHEKCVGNDATLFLVVAGAIMICMSFATLVAHLAKVSHDHLAFDLRSDSYNTVIIGQFDSQGV